ncbi:NUDIX hydrolase [Algoriphagus sp. Y33]|uniref:NUDIX hydrolase n=1 Tax=Algoriphagus sp. Y33 TaxID=2772483 RepID=UPI0017803E8D|nr:NUDIX hydrolase [Algoriphagus sp. Y33]
MKEHLEGVRCVIYKNEKYLLAQHSKPLPENYGKWSLLGGLIQPEDASLEAALLREIYEETKTELIDLIFIGDRIYRNRRYRIFAAKPKNDITWYDTNEISQIKWFTFTEILKLRDDNLLHTGFEFNCVSELITRREYMRKDSAALDPLHQVQRYSRLQETYSNLIQLITNEAIITLNRTNNFLLFSSVFFAGYGLLFQQNAKSELAQVSIILSVLSVIGIAMCFLHSVSIARSKEVANFWRSSIGLIEDDIDFWHPIKSRFDNDLDIFKARKRYLDGIETRQHLSPLRNRNSPLPKIAKWLLTAMPSSDKIFIFWIPGFMLVLWVLCLALGLRQLVSTSPSTSLTSPIPAIVLDQKETDNMSELKELKATVAFFKSSNGMSQLLTL